VALTITATVGSASANSFVTEAEQIAYMATRGNASTWTTVTGATCTEAEKVAIIEATRELSALRWRGYRVDDTQALSWPRYGVANPDSPSGSEFATDVVPVVVKHATCELAFQLVKAGATDLLAQDATEGVIQKVVGPLSTTYAEPYARPRGLARLPSVTRFLRDLLASSGSGALRVVRGG
jgi:hypothetical protein